MQAINTLAIWNSLLTTSIHLTIIVTAVLVVQRLLGRRLSPAWRCGLWAMVLLGLTAPMLPQSRWSVMSLLPVQSAPAVVGESNQQTLVIYGEIEHSAIAAVPTTGAAPSRQTVRVAWKSIAVALWVLGVMCVVGRLIVQRIGFHQVLKRLPVASDPVLLDCVSAASATARVDSVRVVETVDARSPAVTGIFQPTLIVPPKISDRLSREQLQLVVLHEMIHIRRCDMLWRAVASLCTAFQWFNPMIWLASRRFLSDCELACDQAALRLSGDSSRQTYGHTLLEIAEWGLPARSLSTAIGMLGRSSLRVRMRAVIAPSRQWALAGPMAMLLVGCAAVAPPRESADSSQVAKDLVSATYDVRDLLIWVPDSTDAPDFSMNAPASSAPQKPATQPSHDELVDKLTQKIAESVDPASWQSRGGKTGSIREKDGSLLIVQSPTNQEAVAQLLATMREARSVQVNIELRFIRGISKARIREILGDKWIAKDGWSQFADSPGDDAVNRLVKAVQEQGEVTMISAPRITLFDGQSAYMLTATSRPYVKDFVDRSSTTQPAHYEPVIDQINSGVVLSVRAKTTADRHAVSLTLKPQVSQLLDIQSARWKDAPADQDLQIQLPRVSLASLETQVNIADGRSAIFLMQPAIQTPGETRPDPTASPVVMIVKPKIIQQKDRNDLQPAPATKSSTPAAR